MRLSVWEIKILLIAAIALLSFLLVYRHVAQEIVRRKVSRMRTEPKPIIASAPSASDGVVRSTDLSKLSPNQLIMRDKAHKLIADGRPAEGAGILEKAGLLRESVSVLEGAGLIDEACASLMRIQRPNRAAAVFARHRMHQKAAEHYLVASMPLEAAAQFMEAGKNDVSCYEKAARIFESQHQYSSEFAAYALARNVPKIVASAFQHEYWVPLRDFMSDESASRQVFSALNSQQLGFFIEKLPSDEHSVNHFVAWAEATRNMPLVAMVIRKFLDKKVPLAMFWAKLNPAMVNKVVKGVAASVRPDSPEGTAYLLANARALYNVKIYSHAADLYVAARRFGMAAKSFAYVGSLDQCGEALQALNDVHLLERYHRALAAASELPAPVATNAGQWHPDVVAAVIRALDYVDPDNDESEFHSPFSMVS